MHVVESSVDLRDPLWGPRSLELTPEAARFLELIRALGHLDDTLADGLLNELSPPAPMEGSGDQVIDLPDVRRRVAVFLFTHLDRLQPEQRALLGREWPLLFG